MKTKNILAVALVGALAFASAQAQQVPLPKTAAEVPGPAAGNTMTREYVQMVGRSVGYSGGGVTTVNGVSSDNSQSNLGFGLGLGIPITRAVGVKVAYIGTRTQARTGLDSDTFTCAVSVMF